MTPGDRIKLLREQHKYSRADVEAATGIPNATLFTYEQNRTQLKRQKAEHQKTVMKIAALFGVSAEEIWGDSSQMSVKEPRVAAYGAEQPAVEPVLGPPKYLTTYAPLPMRYAGVVPAGDWGDPLESDEMRDVDPALWKSNRYLATVTGDSCWPALQQGDLCVFEHDMSPPPGLVVLAQRKGDHAVTLKQLKLDDQGRPHLEPINPEYNEPPNGDGWGVIARLVCVLRTVGQIERRWYSPHGLRKDDLN